MYVQSYVLWCLLYNANYNNFNALHIVAANLMWPHPVISGIYAQGFNMGTYHLLTNKYLMIVCIYMCTYGNTRLSGCWIVIIKTSNTWN